MAYTTINKSTDYFNTKLYTGNNNVTQTISGVGFQPDFTWIKCRSDAEFNHLADAVRGANKFLHSNNTDAERTGSRSSGYNTMAFTADGFSLTNPTSANDELNFGSRTYASWNWKANGAGSSNNSGTITSTVSANTTSGFSIVSYTGTGANATVGHGLGVAPKFIIFKNRSSATGWACYNVNIGASKYLALNETIEAQTATGVSNSTDPTSSVFSIGTADRVNTNGNTYIAYCFAEVKGYSKFGSYTGNGSTDGTFVYTGFKPAFVIMKRSDSADHWLIKDSVRDSFNVANKRIYPNQNAVEDTSVNGSIDILSNGFKQRGSDALTNGSGGTYIYMAFAEQPLVGTNNVPATAR